jgi:hypothetical protein
MVSAPYLRGRSQGSFATGDVDGGGASALVGIVEIKRREVYYFDWKAVYLLFPKSRSIVWLFVRQRSRIKEYCGSDVRQGSNDLYPTVNSAR